MAIALPPARAGESLLGKLETSEEVWEQPIVEPLWTIEKPYTCKMMALLGLPPSSNLYWVAFNGHDSLLDALDFIPDVMIGRLGIDSIA